MPKDYDLVEIAIFITTSRYKTTNWPAMKSMGSKFLAKTLLSNTETLWLVYLHNNTKDEWHRDKKQVRAKILSSEPKFMNLKSLMLSKNPRITIGGSYPDGSRYAMDLSAKKFLLRCGYLKLIVSTTFTWLFRYVKKYND